ncbi:MAG: type I-C CRISPR-associated protein Cas5c [Oscillospiraceae bacterium]|jgi:CRISPR-associated protein Cas5d|nr:type I-C CRISPR-associated protein Cas5c [Oscillospiraceae bacterium]
MGYGIKVAVWGDYALFTRPEMKVERVSYDVMTPSAARGIIEAVYWKPAIKWVIDKIAVCEPIRFTNIRRNEVKEKITGSRVRTAMTNGELPEPIVAAKAIQQRAAMVLKDVCYSIEAHFELTGKAGETDTKEKHYNIALRRLQKGQCYHQPCFGCREFPAKFALADALPHKAPIAESRDLGYMLYDMDFLDKEDIQPTFFRARLQNGVLDLTNCEVVR